MNKDFESRFDDILAKLVDSRFMMDIHLLVDYLEKDEYLAGYWDERFYISSNDFILEVKDEYRVLEDCCKNEYAVNSDTGNSIFEDYKNIMDRLRTDDCVSERVCKNVRKVLDDRLSNRGYEVRLLLGVITFGECVLRIIRECDVLQDKLLFVGDDYRLLI